MSYTAHWKKFLVFHEEYRGDDPLEVEALDHEYAAELYADYFDSDGDYTIVGGKDEIEVSVKGPDGTIKKFKLSGEMVANYSAQEVE